ncbi:MAG: hypothetical protein FJY17_08880 [Bacteroidetes bacterium]|nr:hypothetical protein [Bacteroidota bacterium]
MNLFKPLAIYLGFSWLSNRLDEHLAELDEYDTELRLRAKAVIDGTTNKTLRKKVNRYFDEKKPLVDIVSEIMNHSQTRKLIREQVEDEKFTENELESLVQSAWTKGFQSELHSVNESKIKKAFNRLSNSRLATFLSTPIGFFIFLFFCMLQLGSHQYLQNHLTEKEYTGIKLFPPFTIAYSYIHSYKNDSNQISNRKKINDLNSVYAQLVNLVDSAGTTTTNSILTAKTNRLYELYRLNNLILNNYSRSARAKFITDFEFLLAAIQNAKINSFSTAYNAIKGKEFVFLESTKYTELKLTASNDPVLSTVFSRIDSIGKKNAKDLFNELSTKQLKESDLLEMENAIYAANYDYDRKTYLYKELFQTIFYSRYNKFY